MVTLLTVVHITVCVFLILVVLLQAGKGGGMGIAFGGAGSQTVFGSSGAGNFLTRLTSITATLFIVTSLALAHYSSRQDSKRLQVLAEKKAADKKVDDEKAAKLKADMEKIRAASAKDGGVSVAPAPALEGTPTPAPIQLKLPGAANETGTAPAGTTAPAAVEKAAAPATGKVETKPGASKAPAAPKAPATKPVATPAAVGVRLSASETEARFTPRRSTITKKSVAAASAANRSSLAVIESGWQIDGSARSRAPLDTA